VFRGEKLVRGQAKSGVGGSGEMFSGSRGRGAATEDGDVLSEPSLVDERQWRPETALLVLLGLIVRDAVDAVPLLFRNSALIGRLAGKPTRPEGSRLRGGEPSRGQAEVAEGQHAVRHLATPERSSESQKCGAAWAWRSAIPDRYVP